MSKNKIIRIVIDIILFVAVINGWWPLAIPLAILGAWYWPHFVEIIVAGVAYDALFGMIPGTGWHGWIGTIISVVLYTVILLIKKTVRR